jgi:hypothetical protein
MTIATPMSDAWSMLAVTRHPHAPDPVSTLADRAMLGRRRVIAHPWWGAAYWSLFALAAVIFALDATVTLAVTSLRPLAVEQNPIARATMEIGPLAPYVLKAAIVAVCGAVAVIFRRMEERLAAVAVIGLMALVGVLGMATAIRVLHT